MYCFSTFLKWTEQEKQIKTAKHVASAPPSPKKRSLFWFNRFDIFLGLLILNQLLTQLEENNLPEMQIMSKKKIKFWDTFKTLNSALRYALVLQLGVQILKLINKLDYRLVNVLLLEQIRDFVDFSLDGSLSDTIFSIN